MKTPKKILEHLLTKCLTEKGYFEEDLEEAIKEIDAYYVFAIKEADRLGKPKGGAMKEID